jgi:type I restriction enzyme, S subunit
MGDYPLQTLDQLAAPEKGAISIGPFGSRMKADVYVESGVRVIRGTNISADSRLIGDWVYVSHEFAKSIPNCIAYPGDLVFPHRGSIGEVALIDENEEPLVISSSMMKFRADAQKADPRFLAHYFKSNGGREEILRFASSVGTPGIGQPLTSLRQFRVPCPNVDIQRAVADLLSILNDKIELNRRANATLEAMTQAIFKDWFVDFGPVRRKMQGETDPATILGGLIDSPLKAAELAALFPDTLGDNGLPEGWSLSKIEEVASRIAMGPFGSRITKDNFTSSGVPVIRGKNLADGFVDSNFVYLTEDKAEELSNSVAFEEDLVFTHRGTLGQVGRIYPGSRFGRYVVSQSQLLLSVNKSKISPQLVYRFFRSPEGQFAWLSHSGGAGVPAISRPTSSLKKIEIIVPIIDVSLAFEEKISLLEKLKIARQNENQTLAQTRDYLLPKLMTGQISARAAEGMLG